MIDCDKFISDCLFRQGVKYSTNRFSVFWKSLLNTSINSIRPVNYLFIRSSWRSDLQGKTFDHSQQRLLNKFPQVSVPVVGVPSAAELKC